MKQTARRRRRYVAMSSSSSSAAATPPVVPSPPAAASSETLSSLLAEDLRAGDSVDFGVSRKSSVRVQDMQRLSYFGGGVARVPGTEEVPEPEGELVVFEAFFAAGLRLPAHRFVGEVLRKFNVQIHQLTPNAIVALYFLMVLVSVVRWMRGGSVDIWWRRLLVIVRDNSGVVGWLRPCHSISGSLRFGAVFSLVGAVFAMEEAVESARRLRTPSAPTTSAISAALGGYSWRRGGVSSGMLVGDVVHLLLVAAVSTGVWLRSPCPRAAGLWGIFRLPLGLNLALVELFGSGVLFKQLI